MANKVQYLDLLEKELNCPICLSTLDDPHSLPCNHQFCRECIHHALKSQKEALCPLCKNPFFKRAIRKNPQMSNIVFAFTKLKELTGTSNSTSKSPIKQVSSKRKKDIVIEEEPIEEEEEEEEEEEKEESAKKRKINDAKNKKDVEIPQKEITTKPVKMSLAQKKIELDPTTSPSLDMEFILQMKKDLAEHEKKNCTI